MRPGDGRMAAGWRFGAKLRKIGSAALLGCATEFESVSTLGGWKMARRRIGTGGTILGVALAAFMGWLVYTGGVQAGDSAADDNRRLFEQVHRLVAERYVEEISSDELYKMAVEGMLDRLGDPYTDFLDSDEWEQIRYSTTGNYGGLGVRINKQGDWITVVQVLPGSPGMDVGLLAGDRIVEVEGETARGWTSEQAVSVLRGPKGEPVNIKVGRPGVPVPLAFRVVRDQIQVRQALGVMLDGRVGLTSLRAFGRPAREELVGALDELVDQGAQGLILDLRGNPGGILEEGIAVADLFLPRGARVVETRSRIKAEAATHDAPSSERYRDVPVVVLVDGFSASASEIVAGALQDHDRAAIVGTTTFGKGSVQGLFSLQGANHVKVTTGRWYTPVGRSISRDRRVEGPAVLDAVSVNGAPITVTPATGEDDEPVEEFSTMTGRTVYGGGGIRPDLVVYRDTLTADEQVLRREATAAGAPPSQVVFRWAAERVQAGDLEPDFTLTGQMRDEVWEDLVEAGYEGDRELFDNSRNWIDYMMVSTLAIAGFGELVQMERLAARDAQVRTAVSLLRSVGPAGDLFAAVSIEAKRRESTEESTEEGN